MKKIILIIISLFLTTAGHAADMTIQELMQKMEKGRSEINDMSYTYTMKYWSPDKDKDQATIVLDGKGWYKKPHLVRSETVDVYMPDKPKHVYITKLEAEGTNLYKILADGTVKKTPGLTKDWKSSGNPPEFWLWRMEEKIAKGFPVSIEYQAGEDAYVVRLDDPLRSTYTISGKTWLLYSELVWDEGQQVFVENLDSDIKINAGVADELFRVPEGNTAPRPGQNLTK